jgi:hypothetical protein
MDCKRWIYIISALNCIHEKAGEGRENSEEAAVAMFDGVKPKATKREG